MFNCVIMNPEGNLVSLVLDHVLTKTNGHAADHYEHVPCLTLPFHIEGYKVLRILGVNDSELVCELQQNEVNSTNEPDGAVFEVHVYEQGLTRFYYAVVSGRFRLIAQDGNSHQTVGEILRIRRGERRRALETPSPETPQLEKWLDTEGEDDSLAIANAVTQLMIIPGVDRKIARMLAVAGFDTIEKVANAEKRELVEAIPEIDEAKAEDTINQTLCVLEKMESGELDSKGWSKTGTPEKPVRVLRLPSIPEPVEKPSRMELPEVGKCTYCSGTLVEDGKGVVCLECGKREQIDRSANDDWDERARKLRREERR